MSKLADCRRCDELEAVPGKGMRCRRGGGFIEPEDLGPISDMETGGGFAYSTGRSATCRQSGHHSSYGRDEHWQSASGNGRRRRVALSKKS